MKNATQMKNAKPQPRRFDPEVLREYDIRGQVGKNLSAADALAVGLSFGTYVRRKGGKNVCVGYDGRASSPGFAQAVIEGLAATGLNVEAIGLGPTPMLYYAVKEHKADGGVMITGSHNPADYNGFKMTLARDPVYGEAVQELGRIAAAGDYATGKGAVTETDIQDAYVERLARDWNGKKNLKVAWDCGNGAAGEIVRRLVRILPGEHILLFDEIDGNFPNHHPDPTVDKNLADLIRTVKEKKFDLGVAFDGDADRIGAVDEKGHVLRCDTMIALYAREVLNDFPGATIVGDVKCSQIMYDEVARLGGKPLMWKTGHSLIKARMQETNAELAGEMSGHMFFADRYYGFDDALYAACRLLEIVASSDQPLSSHLSTLPPTYATPEIRVDCADSAKFRIVSAVREKFQRDYDVIAIDGARVNFGKGWGLVRASNTQPVLVLRFEAQSADLLAEYRKLVEDAVAEVS
jgi:phosphomannomutase